MRVLGRTISLRGAIAAVGKAFGLSPVQQWWGSWTRAWESFTGAWQQNVTVDRETVSAYWAVFACATLIAGDIAKLPAKVMQRDKVTGIFAETLLRPVLRKPNSYQTRLEFFFCYIMSKLLHGNAYVLKVRDERGFVIAMHVLDPTRVTVLVSDDGGVYYDLQTDNLAALDVAKIVPASEIIHDRMYTLHHPLIGVSPLYACGVPAMQGSAIINNSATFFANASRPGGIITAPKQIGPEKAAEIKAAWQANYSGANAGKIAVLGDGLDYKPMTVNPVDAQLIEQLKMTAEMVCACFHVPGYKIGVGAMPTVNNTAALNQQYYDQCLQLLIESMELRMDEGLELEPPYECWLDLSGLLRMDPEARYKSHNEAIKGGWMAPNEARRDEDKPPVPGGDTPYMQEQNWPLAILAAREVPTREPTPPKPPPGDPEIDAEDIKAGVERRTKQWDLYEDLLHLPAR